jgi:hypothetical protein
MLNGFIAPSVRGVLNETKANFRIKLFHCLIVKWFSPLPSDLSLLLNLNLPVRTERSERQEALNLPLNPITSFSTFAA